MSIHVQLDLKPLAKAMGYLSNETQTKIVRDALNRAMDAGYTMVKRAIPRQSNLRQSDVTPRLKKIPAKGAALEARIMGVKQWFSAGHAPFRARQSRIGAAFSPWKKRQTVKGGFVATMRSGHTSIFVRVNRGPGSARLGRREIVQSGKHAGRRIKQLPIADVGWGPSVAREARRTDQPARALMAKAIRQRFYGRFARQWRAAVNRAKARYGL